MKKFTLVAGLLVSSLGWSLTDCRVETRKRDKVYEVNGEKRFPFESIGICRLPVSSIDFKKMEDAYIGHVLKRPAHQATKVDESGKFTINLLDSALKTPFVANRKLVLDEFFQPQAGDISLNTENYFGNDTNRMVYRSNVAKILDAQKKSSYARKIVLDVYVEKMAQGGGYQLRVVKHVDTKMFLSEKFFEKMAVGKMNDDMRIFLKENMEVIRSQLGNI